MDGIVRFRERLECAYMADRDVLKLYHPKVMRRIGGQPRDRVLMGSIGIVLRSELSDVSSRTWVARPKSLSMCDLMNFPTIAAKSALSDSDDVVPEFASDLQRLLSILPNTAADIGQSFGNDFLERSPLDRIPVIANFLRTML